MRVEYFQIWFDIVYLVLGPNSLANLFVFDEGTWLFFHKNHSGYAAKVYENVVNALMAIALGNRSNENYSRRAVFYHKLFRMRVYYSLRLFTVFKLKLFPFSELIAFQSDLSK